MLRHTFIHLPGIGPKTERSLWRKGIHSWDFFNDETEWCGLPIGRSKCEALRARLKICDEKLRDLDPRYFADALPSAHLWRLFSNFRECVAYLDIETTGLGGTNDHITTAALYDGRRVSHYIYGDNLDLLARDLRNYKILVTYNGACFDLPFISNYFGIEIDHVHIDLRYLLAGLGYRGGLKLCEKNLGIDRREIDGVDGWFAVMLWREYGKNRDLKALETLLAYNIADTINLENLMVQAFNMKVDETPFQELKLPLPCPPSVSFKPDPALISELRERCFSFY